MFTDQAPHDPKQFGNAQGITPKQLPPDIQVGDTLHKQEPKEAAFNFLRRVCVITNPFAVTR